MIAGRNERRATTDFAKRLWRRFEGAIDAFHDTDREVLPANAWQFILYFAKQAKGPFLLLLIIGGLAGAVDAALYWSVGWLIDLLDPVEPADAVCRSLAGTRRSAGAAARRPHRW